AACLHQLGRHHEALQALEGHLHLRPDDDEAHLLAARLLRAAEPMRAAAHLQQLHDPRQLPAAMAEADGLDRDGADAAARTAFSALRLLSGHGRRAPGLRAVLGEQLALPAVYRDSAHLACAREAFEQGLAALERDWDGLVAHAEPSLAQLAWCNFKLAYQGQDDRVLQQRHGELLVRAAARMFPDFSSAPRPPRRKRARIGLLSSSWRNCTVGSYFGGWIDWLREAGLELRLYQLGTGDALTQSLGSRAGHLHLHPGFMEHGSLEHGSLEQ